MGIFTHRQIVLIITHHIRDNIRFEENSITFNSVIHLLL